MNRPTDDLDRLLDQALDEIRAESPNADIERRAKARVWDSLSAERSSVEEERSRLSGCADFQRRLPEMLDGELSQARRLLVEDHLSECVTCRRALKDMRAFRNRSGRQAVTRSTRRRAWYKTVAWRAAAAAVIFVALIGVSVQTEVFSFETGGLIHIRSVEGQLLRISDDGTQPLTVGQSVVLEPGDEIRTAKGSRALIELADKSSVEMRERAELAVKERRSWVPGVKADGVIGLQRGNIIVEASPQGSGHLYVTTDDCKVAVQGTVFSVNHGMKGSRVSVIEGQVQLAYGGAQDLLTAGQQATTNPSLAHVPVEQEIAWSQNLSRHMELLREVKALGQEIERALRPDLRYSTELLDLVPQDTVFYASLPNVSGGLGDAWDILKQRVARSELLSQWWQKSVDRSEEADLDQVIDKIRSYGDHFGEEVLLTLRLDERGEPQAPLFIAKLVRPDAFRERLLADVAELQVAIEHPIDIVLIEGELPQGEPLQPDGPESQVFFWNREGLLSVSPEWEALESLAASMATDGASREGESFRDVMAGRYRDGVEWLAGVDLGRILDAQSATDTDEARRMLESLGLGDVQHLIVERISRDDLAENRAELTFTEDRRSFASWLADPAPIGCLDYVSTEANFATAFAMMDIGDQLRQLLTVLGGGEGVEEELARFERDHGIDIRGDIAETLGGEFVFALDGPVLPTPSLMVCMEVYDPQRLQQTLERLVEEGNRMAADMGRPGLQLQRSTVGGRELFEIRSLERDFSVHFAFDDGYFVAGSSTAVVDRALQTRRMQVGLPNSVEFAELLPEDGQVNFSGIIYQKLGPIVGPLATLLGGGALSDEDRGIVEAMALDSRPGVVLFYGEPDRISVVGTSEGGVLSSSLGSLFGFHNLLGMRESMFQTDPGRTP